MNTLTRGFSRTESKVTAGDESAEGGAGAASPAGATRVVVALWAMIGPFDAGSMPALEAVKAQIKTEEEAEAELTKEAEDLTARLQVAPEISHGSESASGGGLVLPVSGSIVSGFGPRGRGYHYGVDISGGTGTPIRAARDGAVVGVSCGAGYGICSIVDHGGGVSTLYAHMSRKAVSGGYVKKGQVIGYVGCTGHCSGPHLHLEVRINGKPRNPRQYL